MEVSRKLTSFSSLTTRRDFFRSQPYHESFLHFFLLQYCCRLFSDSKLWQENDQQQQQHEEDGGRKYSYAKESASRDISFPPGLRAVEVFVAPEQAAQKHCIRRWSGRGKTRHVCTLHAIIGGVSYVHRCFIFFPPFLCSSFISQPISQ